MSRILVADDEVPMRQLMRLACERMGHEVHDAIDTQTAISAYERLKPDLLILDIHMPGGGGPFVLNALRFGGKRKIGPVLVVTGSLVATADEVRSGLNVDRVLPKPFRIGDLQTAVRELLAAAPREAPHPPPD
jgi:CheY-like chemotaxis protein